MRSFISCFIVMVFLATPAWSMSFDEVRKNAAPQSKYFFYLHGAILETQGKQATSPRYGVYHYDRIISHFEDRGLVVIEEVRPKVNPARYAAKIVTQIRQLMAMGVPAANITVGGFSKGGHITLLVASSLGNPDVGYVIMAGCGRGQVGRSFKMFLEQKRGARLKGHIFSIYASSDLDAGSCSPAIEQASGDGLTFRETRIKSNKGHGLFYQPRPEWVEPVARFARERR